MSKTIYVGSLPISATEEEVRQLFEQHGAVHSVNLIPDRGTGPHRGYGFVEMDESEASSAISALNNTEFGGRNLKVSEARRRRESY